MATNTVHATYQEIYDIGTVAGQLSIIGIHTPQGDAPYKLLEGFFRQFKKYKYNGITKLVLQPAAQLPADPLQVSLEAGQNLDPRDLLNPILYHGARGESIGSALNVAYKNTGIEFQTTSTDTIRLAWNDTEGESNIPENLYYSALSDPSFRKFGVQQVIQLGPFVPLVHRLNTNFYFGPNENNNGPDFNQNWTDFSRSLRPQVWDGESAITGSGSSGNVNSVAVASQMFTNGSAELGWMPTRTFNNFYDASDLAQGADSPHEVFTQLPKLYMGVLIFPPSYNQRLFYRCVITHSFTFADFGTYQNPNLLMNNNIINRNPTDYFNDLTGTTATTSLESPSQSLNLSNADGVLETVGVM